MRRRLITSIAASALALAGLASTATAQEGPVVTTPGSPDATQVPVVAQAVVIEPKDKILRPNQLKTYKIKVVNRTDTPSGRVKMTVTFAPYLTIESPKPSSKHRMVRYINVPPKSSSQTFVIKVRVAKKLPAYLGAWSIEVKLKLIK